MRLWLGIARLGALRHVAYGLDVVIALASAVLVLVLSSSLWGAVAAGRPALAGLTGVELSTYVVVAWAASRVCGTRIDENLGQRVRSGQIAADLLKPLDLPGYLLARDAGRAVAQLVLLAAPLLLLGAVLVPVRWPTSSGTWGLTLASLGLGTVVGAHVGLLVGIASVRLRRVTGLVGLKEVGVALLSGALVPLALLPDLVRPVVAWLPFQAMAHTPAVIFLERARGTEALRLLGVQAVWALVLALLARLAWSRARRWLLVEGG